MSTKPQKPKPESPSSKAPARSTASGPTLLLGALVILVITFIAYSPAMRAGFIWDDNDMLTEQHLIKASDGLRRWWFTTEPIDYFPLTMSSLWLEWRLWGMKATGYHVTNILLHVLSAILFWRVLLRLKIPGAWWAGLLFALHPVNVESVAWITERKNTLSLVFYALSLLCFLRSGETGKERAKWYLLSLGAFALSLLSKTSGVMLPFVLLGVAWWQQGKIIKSDLIRSFPFFGLSLAMGLVTIWFQYNNAIEKTVVNELNFFQRLAGAGWAIWFYLSKVLLPLKLIFVYPRWQIDAQNVLSYLPGVAVLCSLAVFWFFRKSWGRPLLIAFGYFVVTLFPVLGFFSIYFHRYSFVADHWQYVSIIGILALLVGVGTQWLKQSAAVVFSIVAIALAVLTWRQTHIYKNQETLWRDTLAKNPRCAMAEANWGLYLANQGNLIDAIPHYEAALRTKPDDEGSLYNFGVALLQTGKHAEAVQKFEETLRVNPNHKLALASLAFVRAIDKDPALRNGAEAVRLALRALELQRDEWNLDTLAAAYAEAGQFENAIKTEVQAIEMATAKGDNALAEDMRKRLSLYQSGQSFREQ